MAEQPVNLSTVLYLGVFSRAEQRVLQAMFKAMRKVTVANLICIKSDGQIFAP
jgi:hypothetical protein